MEKKCCSAGSIDSSRPPRTPYTHTVTSLLSSPFLLLRCSTVYYCKHYTGYTYTCKGKKRNHTMAIRDERKERALEMRACAAQLVEGSAAGPVAQHVVSRSARERRRCRKRQLHALARPQTTITKRPWPCDFASAEGRPAQPDGPLYIPRIICPSPREAGKPARAVSVSVAPVA